MFGTLFRLIYCCLSTLFECWVMGWMLEVGDGLVCCLLVNRVCLILLFLSFDFGLVVLRLHLLVYLYLVVLVWFWT